MGSCGTWRAGTLGTAPTKNETAVPQGGKKKAGSRQKDGKLNFLRFYF